MASKIKVDTLETADGTGSIALSNQLSGMTVASLPTTGTLPALDGSSLTGVAPTKATIDALGIAASSITGALPAISGASLTNLPATDGTPIVSAYRTGNQNVSDSTWTTLQLSTEAIDSDGAFSTSTYEFTVPSGEAGNYYVNAWALFNNGSSSSYINGCGLRIHKNNSTYIKGQDGLGTYTWGSATGPHTDGVCMSWIMNLAVGDTVRLQGLIASPSTSTGRLYTSALNIFKIG